LPFKFIPDNAKIIRLPGGNRVVYVFQADFNSFIPEAQLELTSLGFVAGGPSFDDPNKTRRFHKTYTDGRMHDVEIFNKKLGSVGKSAMEGEWVSISIYEDPSFELRKKRFIRALKGFISRIRNR
jgi:hypothetical protein